MTLPVLMLMLIIESEVPASKSSVGEEPKVMLCSSRPGTLKASVKKVLEEEVHFDNPLRVVTLTSFAVNETIPESAIKSCLIGAW